MSPALRLARMGRGARLTLAAAAGAGFALAQPPWGLWPLILIAGPILFLLWRGVGARAAFWTGWAAGAASFAVSMHWIVEPFLVDLEQTGWMAPFGLAILAGGLGLFPGGAFWLAARLRRGGPAADVGLLAAAWAGAEALRSTILTGFPWALPAYVWTDAPVAQLAWVIGPYGLSLMTLALAFSPALALFPGRARLVSLGALAALAAAWGWGAARLADPAELTDTRIRIVQPVVDQATKWRAENVRPLLDRMLSLTRAPHDGAPPDLIIWPETAVTFPIDIAEAARAEIAIAAGGAEVALGSLRADGGPEMAREAGARWRNSMFLLGPGGALSEPFDKLHLVPFGEYMPFDDLWQELGLARLFGRGRGLVAGDAHKIMTPAGAPPFAPLICYEMIFPRETMAAAEGADWLVLVTNDAWFGTWAGPRQHLAQAQMRAIETGLPVARSANTGISAMIDPFGRLTDWLPHGREHVIDSALPVAQSAGPYHLLGEAGTIMLFIALCFPSFLRYFR